MCLFCVGWTRWGWIKIQINFKNIFFFRFWNPVLLVSSYVNTAVSSSVFFFFRSFFFHLKLRGALHWWNGKLRSATILIFCGLMFRPKFFRLASPLKSQNSKIKKSFYTGQRPSNQTRLPICCTYLKISCSTLIYCFTYGKIILRCRRR